MNRQEASLIECTNRTKRLMEKKPKRKPLSSSRISKAFCCCSIIKSHQFVWLPFSHSDAFVRYDKNVDLWPFNSVASSRPAAATCTTDDVSVRNAVQVGRCLKCLLLQVHYRHINEWPRRPGRSGTKASVHLHYVLHSFLTEVKAKPWGFTTVGN